MGQTGELRGFLERVQIWLGVFSLSWSITSGVMSRNPDLTFEIHLRVAETLTNLEHESYKNLLVMFRMVFSMSQAILYCLYFGYKVYNVTIFSHVKSPF